MGPDSVECAAVAPTGGGGEPDRARSRVLPGLLAALHGSNAAARTAEDWLEESFSARDRSEITERALSSTAKLVSAKAHRRLSPPASEHSFSAAKPSAQRRSADADPLSNSTAFVSARRRALTTKSLARQGPVINRW